MRINRLATATIVLLLGLAACGRTPRQELRPERTVLSAAEIANANVTSAYEAVERLRPEFLRGRGPFSVQNPRGGLPVVYLDGLSYGDINQLRNIPAHTVASITFISAADAATRWGTGHAGGVLEVRSKR